MEDNRTSVNKLTHAKKTLTRREYVKECVLLVGSFISIHLPKEHGVTEAIAFTHIVKNGYRSL